MSDQAGISRRRERGQGLLEYALVLTLVAVVIIAIGVVFGESVQKVYCRAVWAVDPGIDAPMCSLIDVECKIVSTNPFKLEAVVHDGMGNDDITAVTFSVDGILHNKEIKEKYCLVGGDAACASYTNSGTHTFTAVAQDAEGNTGKCEITATVP